MILIIDKRLNPIKTEVLWCSTARHRHQIPTRQIWVGNSAVLSKRAVRDLRVYINADITMSTHITVTIRACFAALRQICSVRRSLTQDALLTLIHSLVITKLDFCYSVLAGVSESLMQRLQSMQNAAARLVFSARRSEHATQLSRELHWLKVPERIQYWLRVLPFRGLHVPALSYLSETLHLSTEVDACRRLRSASMLTLVVPSTCRSTLGDLVFPVAAACACNSLPPSVQSTSSMASFCLNLDSICLRIISSLTLDAILELSFCTVPLQQLL